MAVRVGLLARFMAKPGKEEAVADFLRDARPLAQAVPGMAAWFALQLGPREFGIFAAFPDHTARWAHLDGEIAKALMAISTDLLVEAPRIDKIDVLAAKL